MAYFKRLFSTIFFLWKTTLSHNKLNKRNYEYFFFNLFKVAIKYKNIINFYGKYFLENN